MKKLWTLALALCLTALLCAGALAPHAEETDTEIWNIYSLKEDENDIPHFSLPPSYAYTDEGLRVTPYESMTSYTVQTDHAFYMEDGMYLEIKLDAPEDIGVMVFHMWDQSGIMLSNYHCGSGWQGILQLTPDETQFLMSTYIEEAPSTKENGTICILGTMKVKALVAEDGSVTYSMSLKDGVLRVNDTVVVGMDEALAYMKTLRPDGSVYFGVTVNMTGQDEGIPLTVTRFGTSKETASIPGTAGTLPETGEDATETIATAPAETDPPREPETTVPTPSTQPDRETETLPPEPVDTPAPDTTPEEETTFYDPYGDPPDMTTEEYDRPFAEKETETRREINDEAVNDFMGKMEGCASALGAGTLGLLSAVGASYVLARKKD